MKGNTNVKSKQLFTISAVLCVFSIGVATLLPTTSRLPTLLLSENSETDSPETNDEEKIELAHSQRRLQRRLKVPQHGSGLRLPNAEAFHTSCAACVTSHDHCRLITPLRC